MRFDRKDLTDSELMDVYEALLLPRMIEEKMLLLLRQGKIRKWFSGIGQEAISVGVGLALNNDEYILPLHRNLGIFTTRNIPLDRLFAQFQGKKGGFAKGRDRSFHFGSIRHHLVGMISHLGAQLGVADGIALSHLLRKEKKVTVVFTGDGGASEGDFHEALNVASVWGLPVIFIIENNGYGLSTPSVEQYHHKNFTDKGIGYGVKAKEVDGNNVLEVYHLIKQVSGEIRKNPAPYLIDARTFRMRGHEEASGLAYVPKKLLTSWAKKDPIQNFEEYLIKNCILDEKRKNKITKNIRRRIETDWTKANNEKYPSSDITEELMDIYHPHTYEFNFPSSSENTKCRYIDAISNGLYLACEKYPELILMGQDIAEYGGVFKVTEGMVERFGKDRIRNTPLCESAILGMSLGLSVTGIKSIVEMQFADFVSCGFNQIVNNMAKTHYRWGQHADVVIRLPTGAGTGAGPFHSQSNEAWFFHVPGLKIVYPSTPFDAKGLLLEAIEDPNPVLFFEHKVLYRSVAEEIPDNYYRIPIGVARKDRDGKEISIITYGMGIYWCRQVLEDMKDISADVIDLRSLLPWDQELVSESVKKTGKVIILHEDTLTGGIGGEIASFIGEYLFEYLDGPVLRVGSLDTPVPFSDKLEDQFLPVNRFREKLQYLLDY